jgi:hypothetical protein
VPRRATTLSGWLAACVVTQRGAEQAGHRSHTSRWQVSARRHVWNAGQRDRPELAGDPRRRALIRIPLDVQPRFGGAFLFQLLKSIVLVMTDNDDNPFNNALFDKPIKGAVIVTDMPLLRHFVDNSAIHADISIAGWRIRKVREVSERARGQEIDRELLNAVHCEFTDALVSYGRCFLEADGRRKLTDADVKRLGGDQAIHDELMRLRNDVIAHRAKVHSRTQVYALLAPASRSVRTLALIEYRYPLPSITRLKEYEKHLDEIVASSFSALKAYNERLTRELGEQHVEQLYQLLADGRPWPKE